MAMTEPARRCLGPCKREVTLSVLLVEGGALSHFYVSPRPA
jgi:hypothetical protein